MFMSCISVLFCLHAIVKCEASGCLIWCLCMFYLVLIRVYAIVELELVIALISITITVILGYGIGCEVCPVGIRAI